MSNAVALGPHRVIGNSLGVECEDNYLAANKLIAVVRLVSIYSLRYK